jgi:hypothetical protein
VPLRDFLVQLNIVPASSLKVEPAAKSDRIRLLLNGVQYDDITPKRPFPLSIPEFVIFVRAQPQTPEVIGGEDQNLELCMLKDYRELDSQSRGNLEAVLQKIYFIPTILKVLSLETSGDEFEWELLTDRGERTLHTRGRRNVISMGTRIIIIDTHDNIYQVVDMTKLDRRSRMLLETVA